VGVDLISDGHEQLAGELQWRAVDQAGWHGVPLAPGDNDRWHARFAPRRVGLHEFRGAAPGARRRAPIEAALSMLNGGPAPADAV
ncbi:maltotransferase domain-containing protein, partial [Bordetella pertussis]|uniref:maltotransferase domain-containing protein n=1 Tax=Bordetella pertussis TaxID=520 RepID=UPI000A413D50